MRHCTALDVSGFIEAARVKLAEAGIVSLTIETDFALFQDLACEEVVTRKQFDPEEFDLLSDRGIWIWGRDSYGNTAMLQAMRQDDLGSSNLAAFLQTMLPRVGEGRPEPGAVCRLAEQIRGRVVYHGAGWVDPKYRGAQTGPWAVRMGQAIALLEFDNPDWLYGFMAKRTGERGMTYKQGFVHSQPYSIEWIKEPEYLPCFSLVASTRQDILDMIRTGHEIFVRDEARPQGDRLVAVG